MKIKIMLRSTLFTCEHAKYEQGYKWETMTNKISNFMLKSQGKYFVVAGGAISMCITIKFDCRTRSE